MAKDKDINQGFKIGDQIRHKKNGYEGVISRLEWSGGIRAALCPNGKANRGWYIYTLDQIEIVKEAVKKDMEPEQIENGENDEKESE